MMKEYEPVIWACALVIFVWSLCVVALLGLQEGTFFYDALLK